MKRKLMNLAIVTVTDLSLVAGLLAAAGCDLWQYGAVGWALLHQHETVEGAAGAMGIQGTPGVDGAAGPQGEPGMDGINGGDLSLPPGLSGR